MDAIAALGLVDDEAIRLDEAGLLLSAADTPDADLPFAREIVDAMARRLLTRDSPWASAADRAAMLAQVVAVEDGFRGDATRYDAPENADWLSMLARRRGLPVILSMLYVALARRVGWAAAALNVPGHVLVRIGREPGSVLIDPFEGGALLGEGALAAIVARSLGRHVKPRPDHVAPMTNRATLIRLLSNPAARARKAGDVERALVLTRRMTAIAPMVSTLWWDRARLEQLSGDSAAARESLAAMRETTHDPAVEARIKAAVAALAR
ncbi:SirB1 family protein [Sandaracinobacteroides saxicola]|uniref:Protein SirB1 N-terminal domain-containing protein n=1 Tax=Sandaracinobacteroides saxicola TaxID=2759707 RepID=A0A7G5IGD5_9SPHN|nr:transglutaminase-like domain-containing protein [Sandaracinobacteroides saxicola]QMW22427.1 hypothetical protein H3309_13925 [Sandaracinobacteroides saxicola]